MMTSLPEHLFELDAFLRRRGTWVDFGEMLTKFANQKRKYLQGFRDYFEFWDLAGAG
jgi:hypothetical protein